MATNTRAADFQAWVDQNPEIQQILRTMQAPAHYGGSDPQRRARQQAIHAVIVRSGQHIPPGLKINADGRLEKDDAPTAKGVLTKGVLPAAGIATAMFGIPGLFPGLLGGGGGATATTAGGLLPSTSIGTGMATLPGAAAATGAGLGTAATGAGILGGLSRGLGKLGSVLPELGSVFAGTTAGRARGREAEGNQIDQANQTQTRLFDILSRNALERGRQGADLAAFQRDSPSVRYQQGIKGNLAANLQDFKWAPNLAGGRVQPFEFSGGLRPSAIGAGGREIGEELAKVAAANLGKDTYALPTMPPAPALQRPPQAGVADTLLNTGGTALNFLNALSPLLRRNKPAQPAPRPWDAYEDWQ